MFNLLMQLEYKSYSTHKGYLALALGHPTRFYTNGKKIEILKKFLNSHTIAIINTLNVIMFIAIYNI